MYVYDIKKSVTSRRLAGEQILVVCVCATWLWHSVSLRHNLAGNPPTRRVTVTVTVQNPSRRLSRNSQTLLNIFFKKTFTETSPRRHVMSYSQQLNVFTKQRYASTVCATAILTFRPSGPSACLSLRHWLWPSYARMFCCCSFFLFRCVISEVSRSIATRHMLGSEYFRNLEPSSVSFEAQNMIRDPILNNIRLDGK